MRWTPVRLIAALLAVVLVMAFESLDADSPSTNKRPRMLSMGGAGLASSGDKDSAMMNPASLADVRGTDWQIFPVLFESPLPLAELNAASEFNDSRGGSRTTAEKREELDKFLRKTGTTALKTRINLYPSYTSRWGDTGVHFGLLVELVGNARFALNGTSSNQIFETGQTAATGGLIMAAGQSFFDENLQFGLSVKPLYRHGIFASDRVSVLDIALAQNEGVSFGDQIFGDSPGSRGAFGVGVDVGVKYWLPAHAFGEAMAPSLEWWRPAVGVTYQDIGNTRFFSSNQQPKSIPQSISAGFAVHPRVGFSRNVLAVDFRNLQEKKEFLNKLHIGLESVLWDFWAIRMGASQAYLTGGMGLNFKYFEADVYVSSEERGSRARLQAEQVIGLRLSASL